MAGQAAGNAWHSRLPHNTLTGASVNPAGVAPIRIMTVSRCGVQGRDRNDTPCYRRRSRRAAPKWSPSMACMPPPAADRIHKTAHHHIGQSIPSHGDAAGACSTVMVTDAPVEYDSECRW